MGPCWPQSGQSRQVTRDLGTRAGLRRATSCAEQPAVETFRLTLRHFQTLTTLRGEIENLAERTLSCNEDYERLKSLPGIGPIVALTILAEAGNLRRFGHHRQFLKYFGFDLARYQSGSHGGHEQLSKRGNSRLRLVF